MITSSPQALANHPLVPHALLRMQQRGIRPELVEQVLRYGRAIHARGLLFRVIGRKEVAFFAARGINLRAAEGGACTGAAGWLGTDYLSQPEPACHSPLQAQARHASLIF